METFPTEMPCLLLITLNIVLFSFFDFYFSLRSEEPKEQCVVETSADTDGDVLSSACNSNTEDSQPGGKTHINLE